MRVKTYFFILSTLLAFVPTQETLAQCGARSINTATSYYEIGQFDDVISTLKECLSDGYEKTGQQVEGLCLLTNTYIALDSIARAEKYVVDLLQIDPDFQARPDDPIMFQVLIRKVQLGEIGINVSSVSKMAESLYEAPATVLLITEEEIEQRGYHDLEALLHDLPGFDISQSNGILYSNIYQRGYRSVNTDRTLILVDGVEENDLWGNLVYLSRQYPLSNIESVEVIYGPSSTIYGANAFLGVISINTKKARQLIKEDNRIGLNLQTGYGQWNTRYVDATLATSFAQNQIEITLTARKYLSDEPNFGNHDWLSYNPIDYPNEISLDSLNDLHAITDATEAQAFVDSFGVSSNLYTVNTDASGAVTSVFLTDEGGRIAIDRDNQVYNNTSYQDNTISDAISARLKIFDITVGWQYWHKQEGTGAWFNDVKQATSDQGQSWNPKSQFFFLRYSKQISRQFSITTFTRYKIHSLDGNNSLVRFNGYKSGGLSIYDLMNDSISNWSSSYLTVKSNQMRNETYFTYRPNPKMALFAGVETRFSAIQTDYLTSDSPNPEANISNDDVPRTLFSRDFGVYAQLTYQFRPKFKFTFGNRLDYTNIAESSVEYNKANPRIVLIYQPTNWIFKGIFATAFKAPTNFDRFSTVDDQREINNPDLKAEEVVNYEVSARRFVQKNFIIEAVAYQADYKNIIEVSDTVLADGSSTNFFVSTGRQRVRGGHIVGTFKHNNFEGYFNYTLTNPIFKDTDTNGKPTGTEARVGDIATHQFNIGGNYKWNDFNFNLRMNSVGKRRTGRETTVTGNQYSFEPYTIFNGVISYKVLDTGFKFDLIANNIFNKEYFSPGLRAADDTRFSSRLPQKGRNIHVRVRYSF